MEKKVSVIIPFYNGVDWLHDAVQSVLEQTYKNFEIIVVNDGSPENIESFLSKYGELIIYRYKENGGPASARNLALKIATGDYIAFLDSDDEWLPLKTEKQIAFMNTCGAVWSHTGYFNWYPNQNKTVIKNNSEDYGNVYLKSFISLRANTPAIIIEKKCFELHPEFIFPEEMRCAEDSYLWSLISYIYPLALVEEPLIKVRQRGNNADLSSLLRIQSKSQIYRELKRGVFQNISQFIHLIYYIYNIEERIIYFFIKRFRLNNLQMERIGKFLWVLPFCLERIYLKFIKRDRLDEYKLKNKANN